MPAQVTSSRVYGCLRDWILLFVHQTRALFALPRTAKTTPIKFRFAFKEVTLYLYCAISLNTKRSLMYSDCVARVRKDEVGDGWWSELDTWNHLACRRAASASRHFCRGSTSLSSRLASPPSSDNIQQGCLTNP